jgi:signal transduction histidine kinase
LNASSDPTYAERTGGIEYIEDRAVFARFVRKFQFVLIGTCLIAALGILTTDHQQLQRMAQIAAFLSVVLLSRWSMRFGVSLAAGILVVGLLLLNTVFIYHFAGVHSANHLLYPLVAAFAGWALGKRWLWAIMAATAFFMALLGAGEVAGLYQPTPRAGPILVATIGISTMIGTAFLTNAVFADFASTRNRLTAQNTELLQREQEIQNLNQSLEERVQQRTTELQEAMERLRQSQEGLARAERLAALGALVAGVSHELNTPIGNSITAASTIEEHARSLHDQVQANALRKSQLLVLSEQLQLGSHLVLRNLERAAELIQSFKQVSVDQTSELLRDFNLALVVKDVLATLSPSLRHALHRLELEIPADIQVHSFPGPLGQVIINLVQNAYAHAFEHRETPGLVRVSAHTCTLADGREGVCLLVRDDGCGIPPKSMGRLFEPFFTTKMGRGGTGLGLNIVYNIVKDVLGGEITVQSTEGEGSCFTVTLALRSF